MSARQKGVAKRPRTMNALWIAAMLGVSWQEVNRLAERGMPHTRNLAGWPLFDQVEVADWMAAQEKRRAA